MKRPNARLARSAAVAALGLSLTACASQSLRMQGPESAPIIRGPAITDNSTLLEPMYACYLDALRNARRAPGADPGPLSISVGEVRDFTGKSSINEGAALTQGGTLMVMSALGRLAPAVRIHERFDPRVGELELIYADRRQLGDGRAYGVPGPGPNQMQRVPWLPYAGGTIMRSRYFIVGGITELNWNVQSGGVEGRVNGVGPAARVFTASIAADLRIVDTSSLVVLRTVSLQKQVTGHEVDFNIFRFFGSRLFDISAGTRNQEPIQLAVRATLELGVLELLASVSGVPFQPCAASAVQAGILSRGYDVDSVRTHEPSPQPPFRPQPLPVDGPVTEPQAGPRPTGLGPRAGTFGRSAPRMPIPGPRPDAAMRPAIPSFLQGPQLLPPPGSLSAPANGTGAGRPPMVNPTDVFPDPQRRSGTPPANPQSGNTAPAPTPLGDAPASNSNEPPPPARPVRTLGQNAAPPGSTPSGFASLAPTGEAPSSPASGTSTRGFLGNVLLLAGSVRF
jgi:curli biogenesis system outer membrane secretion channel CsgG